MQNKHFSLPDICQPRALLMLVLVTELIVVTWELINVGFDWARIGYHSLAVQWMVLLSAAVLCKLRPWFSTVGNLAGWLVAFVVTVAISVTVLIVGLHIVQGATRINAAAVLQYSLAIMVIAAMVLRYFQLQQWLNEQNKAELNARLAALQARIEPHFLFNSLNTIAELIEVNPTAAEAAVNNLARLFRANLTSGQPLNTLEKEIELSRGYLEIEQWRLAERLTVTWDIQVGKMEYSVPTLLIQPLVENAIVHGIAPSLNQGFVHIHVATQANVLAIEITNSCDLSAEAQQGLGIGLNNIQLRLAAIYDDRATMTHGLTKDQYRVAIKLPLTEEAS